MDTPRDIDKANAAFAEHVMGWMAVGPRRKPMPGTTMDHDVWMGVPDRNDILREVPSYCNDLKEAWAGFNKFPDTKFYVYGNDKQWMCRTDDMPESYAPTPARAIVRFLLKLSGHPIREDT